MRDTDTRIYVHLVWSTWDRLPLLTPEVEQTVYKCIAEECKSLKAEMIAVGGVSDHVHVLVRLPPTLPVATLVKQLKGASSHLVTRSVPTADIFKWQGSYGAFSIRESDVEACRGYITNQKSRHAQNIGDIDPWALGSQSFSARRGTL